MVIEKGEKYRIYAYYICTRSTWYTQTYIHITYILHCIFVWQHIPLIANTSSLRPRFSHKAYIIIFYVITLTLTFKWLISSCTQFSFASLECHVLRHIFIATSYLHWMWNCFYSITHHIVTYLINHAAIYTHRVSCVDAADAI